MTNIHLQQVLLSKAQHDETRWEREANQSFISKLEIVRSEEKEKEWSFPWANNLFEWSVISECLLSSLSLQEPLDIVAGFI